MRCFTHKIVSQVSFQSFLYTRQCCVNEVLSIQGPSDEIQGLLGKTQGLFKDLNIFSIFKDFSRGWCFFKDYSRPVRAKGSSNQQPLSHCDAWLYNLAVLVWCLHMWRVVCIWAKRPLRLEIVPGFCRMKQLQEFLLPLGWDTSSSQGYVQHQVHHYPLIHLSGERHCDSTVSDTRTQQEHNCLAQEYNTISLARARDQR